MFKFRNAAERFGVRMVVEPVSGSGESAEAGEHGFPADTPLAEMTVEQQVAYWRYHARKHESNRKPKDWEQIVADATAYREQQEANKSEGEKALDAARVEGERAGIKTMLRSAVSVHLMARTGLDGDAVADLLDALDLDKFYDSEGDGLDIKKLDSVADKLRVMGGGGKQSQAGGLARTLSNSVPAPNQSASIDSIRDAEKKRYVQGS